MVACLDDRIVNTHNGRARPENTQGNGNPPPPPSLAQAITSILESHDEQTELLHQLVANSARGGNGARNALALTTYGDFVVTHPPLFTEAGEPLEANHWLRVMESKFGLLCCTDVVGPTTPLLAPQTTKCSGLSSVMLSTPTTSPRA
jgi:hypothetical protein